MNTEKIKQLAARLRSLPHGDAPAMNAMQDYAKFTHECGTVCCIAGEALLMEGEEESLHRARRSREWCRIVEKAMEILGLGEMEAMNLFDLDEWPKASIARFLAAKTLGEERELMAQELESWIA